MDKLTDSVGVSFSLQFWVKESTEGKTVAMEVRVKAMHGSAMWDSPYEA